MRKTILGVIGVLLAALTAIAIYLFTQLKDADLAAVILFPVLLGIIIVLIALDIFVLFLLISPYRKTKSKARYLRLP